VHDGKGRPRFTSRLGYAPSSEGIATSAVAKSLMRAQRALSGQSRMSPVPPRFVVKRFSAFVDTLFAIARQNPFWLRHPTGIVASIISDADKLAFLPFEEERVDSWKSKYINLAT
jgi:hypothetical protein